MQTRGPGSTVGATRRGLSRAPRRWLSLLLRSTHQGRSCPDPASQTGDRPGRRGHGAKVKELPSGKTQVQTQAPHAGLLLRGHPGRWVCRGNKPQGAPSDRDSHLKPCQAPGLGCGLSSRRAGRRPAGRRGTGTPKGFSHPGRWLRGKGSLVLTQTLGLWAGHPDLFIFRIKNPLGRAGLQK